MHHLPGILDRNLFGPTAWPLSASVPTGAAVDEPYSNASSMILAQAAGYAGANWTVGTGFGIAYAAPETVQVLNGAQAPGCSLAKIGTPPAQLVIPSTPPSAPAGTAAFYEFELNSSIHPSTLVFGIVLNGTARLLYALNGSCPNSLVTPGISAGAGSWPTLDSTAAVPIADLDGGSAFLQNHPGSAQGWLPYPAVYSVASDRAVTTVPPIWAVADIATCGALFEVEIDGLTGAVLTNATAPCSPRGAFVNFTETGLPSGRSWSVGMTGLENDSTSSTIGFTMANGTWIYDVPAVPGYAPSPASGAVTVNGSDVTVHVTFSPAATSAVTFHETGLASGTVWEVGFGNASTDSNSSSLGFTSLNGSFPYSITSLVGLTATPSSGTVAVVGSNVTVAISFEPVRLYPVTIRETGLPAGTVWLAEAEGPLFSANHSNAASIGFLLANGTYYYAGFASDPAYVSSVGAALFTVNGAGLAANVTFTSRGVFSATFTEEGLSSGTAWSELLGYDQVNSSASTTVEFRLPNGTYGFVTGSAPGYSATPVNGTITVAGAAVAVLVRFSGSGVVTYPVTFTETGLPSGTSWSVVLDGRTGSSSSTSIPFAEPNGTWGFNVGTVAGYRGTPGGGTITVEGGSVSVTITFSPLTGTQGNYTVTFTPAGLVQGTLWSVTLNGTTNSSTGGPIGFAAPNGSYPFSVGTVRGLAATPSTGTVLVQGHAATVTITFAASSAANFTVTFTETGLATGASWSVTLGGSARSASAASIAFLEPNGTYTYVIHGAQGTVPTPSSGSLTVNGSGVVETIRFAASPPSATSPFFGLPPLEGYAVLAVVLLAVGLGALAVVLRRRGGRSGPIPPPGAT